MRVLVVALVGLACLAPLACKPALIPGTNVEDTEENHKVIDFLAKYRNAVLSRNPDQVLGLVTKDYFEDNGTPDQADDYGVDGLRQRLTSDFGRTKDIQLDLVVQKIDHPENKPGLVRVAYRYNERALVSFPAGDKWISLTDVNRLVLKEAGTGFLIQSGL